ncbi:MAG: signal peptidase I [Candidatus Paceibacterota bacterium]|jgi:hypothetical protein
MNKGLLIILVILLVLLIYLNLGDLFSNNSFESVDCLVLTEEKIVQGNSFSPFIQPGTKIKALLNYYDCHKIEREDIVLFNYAGNKNFLLKIVKGIPGDKFELKETIGGWNIIINGGIAKNFENQPYLISGNKYKMLSLYEKDYQGIIPKNSYLLLSNKVFGSIDSTAFGLVDKSGIVAKVEI